jgi:hypothetical protein
MHSGSCPFLSWMHLHRPRAAACCGLCVCLGFERVRGTVHAGSPQPPPNQRRIHYGLHLTHSTAQCSACCLPRSCASNPWGGSSLPLCSNTLWVGPHATQGPSLPVCTSPSLCRLHLILAGLLAMAHQHYNAARNRDALAACEQVRGQVAAVCHFLLCVMTWSTLGCPARRGEPHVPSYAASLTCVVCAGEPWRGAGSP